eukprot:evm.model.scf_335EXC.2 EVM.evm.TU.scf_335EXC.2   scf_335EXC:12793-16457(-)
MLRRFAASVFSDALKLPASVCLQLEASLIGTPAVWSNGWRGALDAALGPSRSASTSSGLKFWKPTSNGQRSRVTIDRSSLWKGKPFKTLTQGMSRTGGRNNSGRTTSWHIGGGHRKKYRIVSFALDKTLEGQGGVVERLEYDPNRSGNIALVKYKQVTQTKIMKPVTDQWKVGYLYDNIALLYVVFMLLFVMYVCAQDVVITVADG